MNEIKTAFLWGRRLPRCVWCERALALLKKHGYDVDTEYLETQDDVDRLKEVGFSTVPQIWINGAHIGGHDDLVKFLAQGG